MSNRYLYILLSVGFQETYYSDILTINSFKNTSFWKLNLKFRLQIANHYGPASVC